MVSKVRHITEMAKGLGGPAAAGKSPTGTRTLFSLLGVNNHLRTNGGFRDEQCQAEKGGMPRVNVNGGDDWRCRTKLSGSRPH